MREVRRTLQGASKKVASLLTLFLLSVAQALAQEKSAPAKSASDAPQPEATQRRIVISIPDRKLALVVNGEVQKVYRIAVGAADTPSPSGEFKIINRLEKPTYYAPGIAIKPGKKNPLGTRWIGLSAKGIGIHGTNAPGSIGKPRSHGCIRMRNADVEELFALVRVGDAVALHAERTEEVIALFARPENVAPRPAAPAPRVTVLATALPNF
ncbi:MAG TPA: L,D-transpeptidase [Candidatus Nitrosotenuis sp.]|nr:L,D-transpeptidase [Candidatus Nitrosotenuis sp.]